MVPILKRAAMGLLTRPKALKKAGGIVLGVLLLIAMPVAAVLGICSGHITIDTAALQQKIEAQMTEEDREQLQFVEDTMTAIESAMTAAGQGMRKTEAQVLYVFALSEYAQEGGFAAKLAGCFTADQTDEQLIDAVNEAFNTDIPAEDFTNVMSAIRGSIIDASAYVNPAVKNSTDLVHWAMGAKDNHWGYVFGTYGNVLDAEILANKAVQYPLEVGGETNFIRDNWLGRRTVDCVGLIKGYCWYNYESGTIEVGSHGMPDIGCDIMYETATEKGSIRTIPEIPGLAVWHTGHIGIYIGNGQVIQAADTRIGVIQTALSAGTWTHWFKILAIQYEK